jgi:hypothetical protein
VIIFSALGVSNQIRRKYGYLLCQLFDVFMFIAFCFSVNYAQIRQLIFSNLVKFHSAANVAKNLPGNTAGNKLGKIYKKLGFSQLVC